jgi:hypothetical protein
VVTEEIMDVVAVVEVTVVAKVKAKEEEEVEYFKHNKLPLKLLELINIM